MNLAIRGIEANLGGDHADTFHPNLHPDLKADYILANPPFNMSGGERLREDSRWKYGVPPQATQTMPGSSTSSYLAPNGIARFRFAERPVPHDPGEGEIRKNIIEADIVDCMIAMPGQLLYSTQIPVCLWFISRNKSNGKGQDGKSLRDRSGETLFIDARKLGVLYDRVHRELTDDDIKRIADTYHSWRGDLKKKYEDIAGFCMAAKLEEIQKHGYVLTPGRYVGAEEIEDDGDPIEEKMKRLTRELETQFVENARLEKAIRANLKGLRYVG